jgi:transcriptional regulator with XRE-family HTH domain
MTHAELCVRAGISEMTLSAALGGRPVKQRTLAKLAKALAELPIVVGAELLAEPGGQA